jgi:hypothetical protein
MEFTGVSNPGLQLRLWHDLKQVLLDAPTLRHTKHIQQLCNTLANTEGDIETPKGSTDKCTNLSFKFPGFNHLKELKILEPMSSLLAQWIWICLGICQCFVVTYEGTPAKCLQPRNLSTVAGYYLRPHCWWSGVVWLQQWHGTAVITWKWLHGRNKRTAGRPQGTKLIC